ncbi:MAG TPA: TetR/AcrR family transcriptional regulator [Bauldia sp.]|nr:TetR/AcrR family transcriptional regulator [Bauldia sp.]
MTPKTEERRQEMRAALIAAAERTIATSGLPALKARDLAREVGCALGAIYNVFPNLDALVFEVNGRTLAAFEEFLARAERKERERTGEDGKGGQSGQGSQLVRLALVYVEFALANRLRWRALFEHRMNVSEQEEVPAWYSGEQARLFTLVEKPLRALRPDMDEKEAQIFARTLFSGVHGIVSLGLDAKLMALPVSVLKEQVARFVEVVEAGLRTRK